MQLSFSLVPRQTARCFAPMPKFTVGGMCCAKCGPDWMVCRVLAINADSYIVEDYYPEDGATPVPYSVNIDQILQFPIPARSRKFARRERVLALWLVDNIKGWTSTFFPAEVRKDYREVWSCW